MAALAASSLAATLSFQAQTVVIKTTGITVIRFRVATRNFHVTRAAADSTEPSSTQKPADDTSSSSSSESATSTLPKKPVYSMKKGQIVRVDKEKYLNSVNYLSVGHPPYYKGLDYIYENRGEVLDLRNFETGEYALIAWVGVPTAPAWLPTDMLIKSDKLQYERM
uniref:NADH dehydrogenase-like complex O n=1 Tax=Kalanchoe fedtschenkoi TaxID=63787 RepID=A0A7N0ZW13_KALFE